MEEIRGCRNCAEKVKKEEFALPAVKAQKVGV
jgi:hypothetical protein